MKKFPYKHKVTIAGHRGDPAFFPENTVPSYKSAIDKGVDMVEIDCHMTKDGEIIIMHDHTVDRTTDGTGDIYLKTLAEMKSLTAGEVNGEKLKVPTMREFCEFIKPYDVLINVEFKDYADMRGDDFARESMLKTLALIEEYALADRCVMNSWDARVLKWISECEGGKYLTHGYYPYKKLMRNVEDDPTEYLYCACLFDYEPDHAKFLIDNGIECWLGAGVKTKEEFALGISLGANLFTTNDPAAAIKICEELGVR